MSYITEKGKAERGIKYWLEGGFICETQTFSGCEIGLVMYDLRKFQYDRKVDSPESFFKDYLIPSQNCLRNGLYCVAFYYKKSGETLSRSVYYLILKRDPYAEWEVCLADSSECDKNCPASIKECIQDYEETHCVRRPYKKKKVWKDFDPTEEINSLFDDSRGDKYERILKRLRNLDDEMEIPLLYFPIDEESSIISENLTDYQADGIEKGSLLKADDLCSYLKLIVNWELYYATTKATLQHSYQTLKKLKENPPSDIYAPNLEKPKYCIKPKKPEYIDYSLFEGPAEPDKYVSNRVLIETSRRKRRKEQEEILREENEVNQARMEVYKEEMRLFLEEKEEYERYYKHSLELYEAREKRYNLFEHEKECFEEIDEILQDRFASVIGYHMDDLQDFYKKWSLKVRRILKALYSLDILDEEYRGDVVAISYFIRSLEKEWVESLKGRDQAYAKWEEKLERDKAHEESMELLTKIDQKLDGIDEKLDEINNKLSKTIFKIDEYGRTQREIASGLSKSIISNYEKMERDMKKLNQKACENAALLSCMDANSLRVQSLLESISSGVQENALYSYFTQLDTNSIKWMQHYNSLRI